jgi:hypothetical protein
VSGQLHALADLPRGKNPDTHCIGGWVGPIAGVVLFEDEENLLLLPGIEPWIVQPVA